jgi:SAM-dependent methyltransferase
MDRRAWLDERRASVEERYDRLPAPTYDGVDIPITPTHRRFVEAVIGSCPVGGTILDAACGTGPYFQMVLAAGRRVIGVDQSAGMLAEAHRRFPDVELLQVRLQALWCDARVDGVLCVDAMEYVGPEDWPDVLARLRAAVSGGLIYLTVEQVAEAVIEAGYVDAIRAGWPAVRGETTRGGGYHHYPTEAQVRAWIDGAGLRLVDEGRSAGQGYSYWHLIMTERSRSRPLPSDTLLGRWRGHHRRRARHVVDVRGDGDVVDAVHRDVVGQGAGVWACAGSLSRPWLAALPIARPRDPEGCGRTSARS